MNRSRTNEIIVGLFVIVSIAVFTVMTFVIRGTTGISPYVVRAEFPNVSGLELGSPVLVDGFRLGRVIEMLPVRGKEGEQNVIIVVRASRTIPIYKDATATLVQQGFIGDKRVEIDPGTPIAGEIADNELISAVPPQEFGEIIEEGKKIAAEMKATLESVRAFVTDKERLEHIDNTLRNVERSTEEAVAILEENRKAIRSSIANFEDVSERSAQMAQKAEAVVEDARITAANFRESSRTLSAKVDALVAKANEVTGNANELMVSSRREIEEVSASIQETNRNLNLLLEDVNAGRGTVGRLMKDPRPFEDLQESIAALRSLLLKEQDSFYGRDLPYRLDSRPVQAAPVESAPKVGGGS